MTLSTQRRPTAAHRQRGATLLIGLVMLGLLTIYAIAGFHASSAQLRIVGNMQAREEAQAAANLAVAGVMSSGQFLSDPAALAASPAGVDVNADGVDDYRVVLAATCYSARPVLHKDLDPAIAEDLQCLAGAAFGPSTLCADSHWNLQAVATAAGAAAATGATAEIHQGTVVRIDAAGAQSFC